MRKIATLALMISLALVLSLIDSSIPVLPMLPGIKLGLANIIVLLVLKLYGYKDALTVSVLKCLLAWFFHGSFIALILSLSGGVISVLLMALLIKGYPKHFSLIGISVGGAEAHNIGQILAASILVSSPYIFSYLPYLLFIGVITGAGIGFLAGKLIKAFEDSNFVK